MSINFRLKSHLRPFKPLLGQRKAFCWERIPESSPARKETVDIGIFVPSRNGEPVEQVSVNIYQSNTYRKDLSWLYFDDEQRV